MDLTSGLGGVLEGGSRSQSGGPEVNLGGTITFFKVNVP